MAVDRKRDEEWEWWMNVQRSLPAIAVFRQNDMGIRDGCAGCCAKHMGMQMMLRSMTPEILAVDEIGSRDR